MRETDEAQRGLSLGAIVAIIVVIVAALVAGMFLVRFVSDQAPTNVVVLEADRTSFKEKPAEEKAPEDAGTKSTVMIMLDELADNKEEIEILPLQPDAPEMPEVTVESPSNSDQDSQSAASELPAQSGDNEAPASGEQAPASEPDASDDAVDVAETTEQIKPKKRPIKPLVIENPVASGPSLMVQLAAFRNQEKAQEVAALLTEKHKERLWGLTLGVMQADTGSSGIFWRVTTEPLPTEDARDLCDGLKRAGQDCIFRKVAVE